MAVGEGGPELAKQLLKNTGHQLSQGGAGVPHRRAPRGVGPHDVAIALVKATFASGFVNNCVLEFCGPGVAALPHRLPQWHRRETTETTCLSSIWETDGVTDGFYRAHQRPEDYRELHPADGAYYDKYIEIDLSKVEPMIALPFHPSNAWTIHEFLGERRRTSWRLWRRDAQKRYPKAHVKLTDKIRDGGVWADQGVIAVAPAASSTTLPRRRTSSGAAPPATVPSALDYTPPVSPSVWS